MMFPRHVVLHLTLILSMLSDIIMLVLSCKLVSLQCKRELQFLPILGYHDIEASLLYEPCQVSVVSTARVDHLVAVGLRDQELFPEVPRL